MSEIDVALRCKKGAFELDARFAVPASGVTAIFGRSGSGKTTLLRAIAGLDRAAGQVRVAGRRWQSSEGQFVPAEQRRIGYVFQEAALFPHLSVEGNLLYAQQRAHPGGPAIGSVIAWLGLASQLRRAPKGLSGGERQRVAIARALLSNPVLLLMDEPIASLDVAVRGNVLDHLTRLRRELDVPILYVTHAIDEVGRLADRVLWLDAGRVQCVGAPSEVFSTLDMAASLEDEASGFVDAVVRCHDDGDQLTELDSPWGELFVPRIDAAPGASVRVRIRASDVSISLEPEQRGSILNTFPGVVAELRESSPGQVLLAMTCPADDSLTLLARVTRRSMARLQLRPQTPVHLRVKSVSVR